MTVHVTDHALVRFLERAGGFPVEMLRDALAASLARAARAAGAIGEGRYTVKADGLIYVVLDGRVVTILAHEDGPQGARPR